MREATWIIDRATGALTVEGMSESELTRIASDLLHDASHVNCARPLSVPPLRPPTENVVVASADDEESLQVYRIYHGSVVEGEGRRSVVQVSGCSIRCAHCHAKEAFDPNAGVRLKISEVIELLLAPEGDPRDGVTVLGGEPFDQPAGLAALTRELKTRGLHITLYSGYTIEELSTRGRRESSVIEALKSADVLIEGRFVAALSKGAGEWRGSTNQLVIRQPVRHLREGS